METMLAHPRHAIGWGDKVARRDSKKMYLVVDVNPSGVFDFMIENELGHNLLVKAETVRLIRKANNKRYDGR